MSFIYNSKSLRSFWLFISVFFFSTALFFGVGTLLMMIWPVIASSFDGGFAYHPQLPIAQSRRDNFYDITTQNFRVLYPRLTEVDDIKAGNWISIPSINVKVPLTLSGSMDDKDVLKALDRGAALYPNGISPGRLGNVFISAHSTGEPWKGKYRFAFHKINKLGDNNLIHLDYDNTRYTYRIVSKETVVPDSAFSVVSDRPVPTVTLMACWPLWTTSKRMLVHGELTNVTQLTSKTNKIAVN